jgi:hypothetical protein
MLSRSPLRLLMPATAVTDDDRLLPLTVWLTWRLPKRASSVPCGTLNSAWSS